MIPKTFIAALAGLLLLGVAPAFAAETSVKGLFVSDIHFDPFHDPAKVAQLNQSNVNRWERILSSAPSPTQAADFANLQKTCASSAPDTYYSILDSAATAMRAISPRATFIVVSGDLIAHQFNCRYATLLPGGSQADYAAFVEKTVWFVVKSLRKRFPKIPIYITLGNNDSNCGDYKLDTQSAFLQATGKLLGQLALHGQKEEMLRRFANGGYYAIEHPHPLINTRIVVLNDILLSAHFTNCTSSGDPAAGAAEIAWLKDQLQQAESQGQKVWLVGHIPPGIDPYFLASAATFCAAGSTTVPAVFLSSNDLGDAMHNYAHVISLAIFAHTHMDEFRLVQAEGRAEVTGQAVPLKMMSSISPVFGNYPSFTVGEVNRLGGGLQDYTVYASSNKTGVDATWSKEYSFCETYGASSYSSEAVKQIVLTLQQDTSAQSPLSRKYIQNYDVKNQPAWLTQQWSKYTCSLTHMTVDGFTSCACGVR